MTDIAGVSAALARAIDRIVYPNGDRKPSITGRRTIIRRGWITNEDYSGACSLRGGVDYVFVTALAGAYKAVDCALGMPWREKTDIPATVSVETTQNTATIIFPDDVAPVGIVGLYLFPDNSGAIHQRSVVAHLVADGDTPESVAVSLASLIPDATAEGATITLQHVIDVKGAVAGHAMIARTTRRQQQIFTVSIWTGTWGARDVLGGAIDSGLSGDPFIHAPDGTSVLVEFAGAAEIDTLMTQNIWRRDLKYRCTFDTIQTDIVAEALFGVLNVQTPGDVTFSIADWPLNPA